MKDEIKLWKEKTKGLFNIVEWTKFWNYITNLQEENEKLNHECDTYMKIATNKQKLLDFEIERNGIKQEIIDKANDYINEYFIFDDKNGEYYQTHTFDKYNAKELLNILQGSDKE